MNTRPAHLILFPSLRYLRPVLINANNLVHVLKSRIWRDLTF